MERVVKIKKCFETLYVVLQAQIYAYFIMLLLILIYSLVIIFLNGVVSGGLHMINLKLWWRRGTVLVNFERWGEAESVLCSINESFIQRLSSFPGWNGKEIT